MNIRTAHPLILAGGLALAACNGDGSSDKDTDTTGPEDSGTSEPTGAAQVWVNEVMASNATILQDETGQFPDWIELFNPNDDAVDLSGWWLTDDTAEPLKSRIPDGVSIEAHGWLVFFADSDPEEGDLHLSFNLSAAGGEDVALYGPNTLDNPLVDSVEDLAAAVTDVSIARMPDGGPTWEIEGGPTPGAANE